MKSTVDLLTTKEREALVRWYDTESYNALIKLLKLENEGLGRDALASQKHSETTFYAGQSFMANKLIKLVREMYQKKEQNKAKN